MMIVHQSFGITGSELLKKCADYVPLSGTLFEN